VALSSLSLYKRFLRPIRTVRAIPLNAFHKRKLYGLVTRVGDGDNFHFFHTPGGILTGWHWLRTTPKANAKKLKGKTLHVRLCGVDAPERAHFGKPAQPFGDEAMVWLTNYILGKRVKVKPLSLDQYGRVVGKVFRFHWWGGWRDVSLEMIKHGWGVVYESKTFGQFDGQWDKYTRMEQRARAAKRGIWSKGKHIVTPGEFKKKMN
jgi:micrococcal nuclease